MTTLLAKTVSAERVRPKVSLATLAAMADWKEGIQGRIQCARVRLNLGLQPNDAQLAAEVAEFAAECRRLCRKFGGRRAPEGRLVDE
jgi:hypothetical protein